MINYENEHFERFEDLTKLGKMQIGILKEEINNFKKHKENKNFNKEMEVRLETILSSFEDTVAGMLESFEIITEVDKEQDYERNNN